ncbi:trypsin-1-like isoform X3 [Portunus trituberculatus]|uniref:trypsin-1-like isoform X3 n=1 Tax=Portunus trituberculatus TaxID=210409 RepID=UPI001E1D0368|nr:trypsin-1-like isoform X3 [Portunus trituberculatus]
MISHRHRGSLGVIVFPCLDRHNTTEKMNLFAVLLCVFLADIQSSQGRTFPVPLPASHTPNGVMLPGWRDGNERSKTDGNTLPVKPRIFNGTEAEKLGEQHREVKNIVIHPGWDNVTLENDIALLKLSEKLELDGKTVAPISLPTSQTNSTGKCVMAGWGRTNYESNTLSDVLKKVTVPIVPDEQCRKKYDILHEKVLDSMICAGYEKGDENAFQGDNGGPLVCQGKNKNIFVAGVASWAYGFIMKSFPDVYTEVSYFVDWINEVRNQESLQH